VAWVERCGEDGEVWRGWRDVAWMERCGVGGEMWLSQEFSEELWHSSSELTSKSTVAYRATVDLTVAPTCGSEPRWRAVAVKSWGRHKSSPARLEGHRGHACG
jgi:hypothetical protein